MGEDTEPLPVIESGNILQERVVGTLSFCWKGLGKAFPEEMMFGGWLGMPDRKDVRIYQAEGGEERKVWDGHGSKVGGSKLQRTEVGGDGTDYGSGFHPIGDGESLIFQSRRVTLADLAC